MKKKQLHNYFLLFAVAIVWCAVAYQVYKTSDSKPKKEIAKYVPKTNFNDTGSAPLINHTYDRDPFLSIQTDTMTIVVEEIEKPIMKEKPAEILPAYYGRIRGDEVMAIIKFNNKVVYMKKGETKNGIKILSIADSQVVVKSPCGRHNIRIQQNQKDEIALGRK